MCRFVCCHEAHFRSQPKFEYIITAGKVLLQSVDIYGSYRVDQPASKPYRRDGSNVLKSPKTNVVQRYFGSKTKKSLHFLPCQMIYTPIPMYVCMYVFDFLGFMFIRTYCVNKLRFIAGAAQNPPQGRIFPPML